MYQFDEKEDLNAGKEENLKKGATSGKTRREKYVASSVGN